MAVKEIDVCRGCGKPKSPETFGTYVASHGPDAGKRKLVSQCRECVAKRNADWNARNPDKRLEQARESARRSRQRHPDTHYFWELKKKYGITKGEYMLMLIAQNGLCAACGEPPPNGKRLDIDHCHRAGAVRGLLCGRCNRALGMVDDSIHRLTGLIAYLERHRLAL